MQTYNVEARDIPDAWFQLVDLCYQEGRDYVVSKGSYQSVMTRRELDHVTLRIKYPCTQPRDTRIPTIPSHYGIPDPIPEGIDYVDKYLPYLMSEQVAKNELYTYGSRLMGATEIGGISMISQVDEVIRRYKLIVIAGGGDHLEVSPRDPQSVLKSSIESCGAENCLEGSLDEHVLPEFGISFVLCRKHEIELKKIMSSENVSVRRNFATNQLALTIAQPSDIHLKHSPCLREIGTRIYEPRHSDGQKLNFIILFRSHDLWVGLPANFCAIADLMDFMAGEIGVEPGEFIYTSYGLHLYDMYWELAKTRLGVTKENVVTRENIISAVRELEGGVKGVNEAGALRRGYEDTAESGGTSGADLTTTQQEARPNLQVIDGGKRFDQKPVPS